MSNQKLRYAAGFCLMAMILFSFVTRGSAAMIFIDADGFGDNVDISEAFINDGVILSSVGGYDGLDGKVYAHGDGLASSGVSVFANNLSFERQWWSDMSEGFALRADFSEPADYVSIDIIGDDISETDIGGLYAYDLAGGLLGSDVSYELGYGEVYSAQIDLDSFEIAYIVAGGGGVGVGAETVHLDNMNVNIIPEPVSIVLFGLGGWMVRRKAT